MGVPVSVLCGKLPLVVNRQFKFCNFSLLLEEARTGAS